VKSAQKGSVNSPYTSRIGKAFTKAADSRPQRAGTTREDVRFLLSETGVFPLRVKELPPEMVNGAAYGSRALLEVRGMLALLGVMGALFAGIMAESVMSSNDDGEGNQDPEEDVDIADTGNLLDEEEEWSVDPGPDPELDPVSDDVPDAPVEAMVLEGDSAADILAGQDNDDEITGAQGDDQIDGRAGDDRIEGDAGDDHALGGDGDDQMFGGTGNDGLHGQDGQDRLSGGEGADTLSGHEGDDLLTGGGGGDSLLGGGGDDALSGGTGDDWLAGGYGEDALAGGAGSDTLDGNAGDDRLDGSGDAFPDFLNGGDGDDSLVLGKGDIATGGEGTDSFSLRDWMEEGGIAAISDFDAEGDELVVVYDAAFHTNPHLTSETAEDTGDVTILLDGNPVAIVAGAGAVDLSQIRLAAA